MIAMLARATTLDTYYARSMGDSRGTCDYRRTCPQPFAPESITRRVAQRTQFEFERERDTDALGGENG